MTVMTPGASCPARCQNVVTMLSEDPAETLTRSQGLKARRGDLRSKAVLLSPLLRGLASWMRGYPNGSCRRGDLNPHVLADTRPSTSECNFYSLVSRSTEVSDLHGCGLDVTQCNSGQASKKQSGIRYWIKNQSIAPNHLPCSPAFPPLFSSSVVVRNSAATASTA